MSGSFSTKAISTLGTCLAHHEQCQARHSHHSPTSQDCDSRFGLGSHSFRVGSNLDMSRKGQGFTIRSISYCWWKESCTTQHVWNPLNNGKFTISTGANFLPSTVGTIVPQHRWQKRGDTWFQLICWMQSLLVSASDIHSRVSRVETDTVYG